MQAMAGRDHSLRIDIAFACYAFLGLSMTAFGLVSLFVEGPQASYGMFLFLTLPLPMLAAFVTTIVLTAIAPRYRPLLLLCVIHILFAAGIGLVLWSQSAEGASETPVDSAILSYGAFFILVPIKWFAIGRQRYRNKVVTGV